LRLYKPYQKKIKLKLYGHNSVWLKTEINIGQLSQPSNPTSDLSAKTTEQNLPLVCKVKTLPQ
jgi:hypothetical protein